MEVKLKANLERGKKWKIAKDKAAFMVGQSKATQEEADWFDTQSGIMKDIEQYEFFTKYPEALKKHTEEFNKLSPNEKSGNKDTEIYDKLVEEYNKPKTTSKTTSTKGD